MFPSAICHIERRKQIKNKFSLEEDEKLKSLVSAYGPNNWKQVSNFMPSRSSRQCKERWTTYLAIGINQTEWNPDEDLLLINVVSKLGTHWRAIKGFFQSRTETNIKNRWTVLMRKRRKLLLKSQQPHIENETSNCFEIIPDEIEECFNTNDFNNDMENCWI